MRPVAELDVRSLFMGRFPLLLTALNRDYKRGTIPGKDC